MIGPFFRKIIALLWRRRLDRELAEEIETHRAILEEGLERRMIGQIRRSSWVTSR